MSAKSWRAFVSTSDSGKLSERGICPSANVSFGMTLTSISDGSLSRARISSLVIMTGGLVTSSDLEARADITFSDIRFLKTTQRQIRLELKCSDAVAGCQKKRNRASRASARTDFIDHFHLFPFVTSINSVQALSLSKDSERVFSNLLLQLLRLLDALSQRLVAVGSRKPDCPIGTSADLSAGRIENHNGLLLRRGWRCRRWHNDAGSNWNLLHPGDAGHIVPGLAEARGRQTDFLFIMK